MSRQVFHAESEFGFSSMMAGESETLDVQSKYAIELQYNTYKPGLLGELEKVVGGDRSGELAEDHFSPISDYVKFEELTDHHDVVNLVRRFYKMVFDIEAKTKRFRRGGREFQAFDQKLAEHAEFAAFQADMDELLSGRPRHNEFVEALTTIQYIIKHAEVGEVLGEFNDTGRVRPQGFAALRPTYQAIQQRSSGLVSVRADAGMDSIFQSCRSLSSHCDGHGYRQSNVLAVSLPGCTGVRILADKKLSRSQQVQVLSDVVNGQPYKDFVSQWLEEGPLSDISQYCVDVAKSKCSNRVVLSMAALELKDLVYRYQSAGLAEAVVKDFRRFTKNNADIITSSPALAKVVNTVRGEFKRARDCNQLKAVGDRASAVIGSRARNLRARPGSR